MKSSAQRLLISRHFGFCSLCRRRKKRPLGGRLSEFTDGIIVSTKSIQTQLLLISHEYGIEIRLSLAASQSLFRRNADLQICCANERLRSISRITVTLDVS